jgi:methylthioribose-1-phosphate isomerase
MTVPPAADAHGADALGADVASAVRPAPLPPSLEWVGAIDGELHALDQSLLPHERVVLKLRTADAVADAILRLAIRGAPIIGVAAAYGLYLGVRAIAPEGPASLDTARHVAAMLLATRPTAVNLRWALDRCLSRMRKDHDVASLLAEAARIDRENAEATFAIARNGAELVHDGATILTHCNAGPLACGGIGTALGCLIEAHRRGTRFSVLADETRPLLQGARLTALELAAEGIPVAVIPDSAAPAMIARGAVQAVFVGADRIASNGDFANKIGTYSIALAASVHRIPFYVVAPMSTFDGALAHGQQIPIEERAATEVLTLMGSSIAAAGIDARNPAFDVSPAALATAFVTDQGILRPPFAPAIKAALATCR